MKKTLQNSMRESISSIDGASRNALHGFIFTNDSATVAYFQEHETGNIHKLEPDTPITVISNSDEELTHIETTGKDVLETLTTDGQVAYAGADAFLAMSEAALLVDAEAEQPQEEAKPKCTITLYEKEHLPGAFITEVVTPECTRTIHNFSIASRAEYVKSLTEQLEMSGVSYVVNGLEGGKQND